MTEQELRKLVLDLAARYLGATTGDDRERQIVDVYNAHTPLPRNYKVTYTDNWCMTFVSAISEMAELQDIFPIECGCGEAVKIARNMGTWHGNSFTPQPGDIVMYDWNADGWADHTGFVEVVAENYITTIEGNATGGVCARRTTIITDKQILGYITPNYASKAKIPQPKGEDVLQYADYFDKAIAGQYKVKTGLYLRCGAGTKYKSITVMPKGATVRNYGYFSLNGKTPWFYVKYGDVIGFCNSTYLQKV